MTSESSQALFMLALADLDHIECTHRLLTDPFRPRPADPSIVRGVEREIEIRRDILRVLERLP